MSAPGLLGRACRDGLVPQLVSGLGTAHELRSVIGHGAEDVLVVASERAVNDTAALSRLVQDGAGLHDRITPNPTLALALELADRIAELRPRTIVALGGGSTLDLAKAARLLPRSLDAARKAMRGDAAGLRVNAARLVAVPTTAGTGSEMTPFATMYDGGRKVSLDDPRCRPDVAILDATLTRSCPATASVPAYLDALTHSIESYWSRKATAGSRLYAAAAMDMLVTLAPACGPTERRDESSAQALLVASALAGVAISMTRTTAPHAFSYWLTVHRGLAHGFACALSLWWLADYNWCARPRADSGLERTLRRVGAHPDRSFFSAVCVLRRALVRAIEHGLCVPPDLADAELRSYLAAGLGVRSRAENNPVPLVRRDLIELIAFPPNLAQRPDSGVIW